MSRGDLTRALADAAAIVDDVRERGDAALLEWTERLDGERPESLRVPAEAIAEAEVEPDVADALRALAEAVEAFHAPQRPVDTQAEPLPGVEAERRFVPIRSVGVYAPGGRAAYPSSLVMAVVPARLAGVERIAVASPKPGPAILAAARELGVDEVYSVGGAQAVAALAFGTETVQPVAKIVGPGNRWVTAAKLLVASRVGIDLPAGPSEVLVIGDETADPALCAADLLAQCEHGPDSAGVLLTTDPDLAQAVGGLVAGSDQVEIEVVESLDAALDLAESYAPEHLELLVADPEPLVARIRNAGTVFVGPHAPTALGDYAAGANHILPTGGLARASGALGVESFLKPVQVVRATADGLAGARRTIDALARVEGLPLHAASVDARFALERA